MDKSAGDRTIGTSTFLWFYPQELCHVFTVSKKNLLVLPARRAGQGITTLKYAKHSVFLNKVYHEEKVFYQNLNLLGCYQRLTWRKGSTLF